MRTALLTLVSAACLLTPVAAQQATLRVGGAVAQPFTLTPAELAALPHQTLDASAHDQQGRYSGVPLIELLKRAGVVSGEALRGRELTKARWVRQVVSIEVLDAPAR